MHSIVRIELIVGSSTATASMLQGKSTIHDPRPFDILLGRGKIVHQQHLGNQRFRAMVALSLVRFKQLDDRWAKSRLVKSVKDDLLSIGSRFLMLGKDSTYTLIESDRVIHDKIRHALRDYYRARISFDVYEATVFMGTHGFKYGGKTVVVPCKRTSGMMSNVPNDNNGDFTVPVEEEPGFLYQTPTASARQTRMASPPILHHQEVRLLPGTGIRAAETSPFPPPDSSAPPPSGHIVLGEELMAEEKVSGIRCWSGGKRPHVSESFLLDRSANLHCSSIGAFLAQEGASCSAAKQDEEPCLEDEEFLELIKSLPLVDLDQFMNQNAEAM